jgi:hypothetical protein
MRPASRSDEYSTRRSARRASEAQPPTTEGLSGIEFQSSYDPVSLVQSLPASKACTSRLEMPRIRLAGSFHQIELRDVRIKHTCGQ